MRTQRPADGLQYASAHRRAPEGPVLHLFVPQQKFEASKSKPPPEVQKSEPPDNGGFRKMCSYQEKYGTDAARRRRAGVVMATSI
jgi:hypothetical protein